MANDIENKENEIEDENIDIGDIEGLERDSSQENSSSNEAQNNKNEEYNADNSEPLEILKDGKLKTSQKNFDNDEEEEIVQEKSTLKDKIKESKIIKILIAVLAVLILLIIAFVSFSSSNQLEELPAQTTTTKAPILEPLETYTFKLDHINVSRLNKKLEHLTKYELLGMTEEEYLKEEKLKALRAEKEEEELKLRLEEEARQKVALELAQKEALELENKNKAEEDLAKEQNKESKNEKNVSNGTNVVTTTENNTHEKINEVITQEEKSANNFLKFIQINTNKKAIYKSYLQELKKLDSRIYACRNINNLIEVFIGPLNKDEDSTALVEAIKKIKLSESIIEIELTKEEFASRCMVFEE